MAGTAAVNRAAGRTGAAAAATVAEAEVAGPGGEGQAATAVAAREGGRDRETLLRWLRWLRWRTVAATRRTAARRTAARAVAMVVAAQMASVASALLWTCCEADKAAVSGPNAATRSVGCHKRSSRRAGARDGAAWPPMVICAHE